MRNVISQHIEQVMKAVDDQTNRISAELSANFDAQNAAQTEFNTAMSQVADLRRKADELQAQAVLKLDTALTNAASIGLSLLNQLQAGEIVTGTPTPARKPKLVQAAE